VSLTKRTGLAQLSKWSKTNIIHAFTFIGIILILALVAPSRPADFVPLYNGAVAVREHRNPFDRRVVEQNQRDVYGRLAIAGEDEFRGGYPVPALFIGLPLTVLPIGAASVVYRVFSATLLILALVQLGVKPLWAFVVLFLLREPVVAFTLGQFTLWTSACAVFALSALKQQQDTRAALWFALASGNLILTVPLALLMLLARRRALLIYIGAMGLWYGVSFLTTGWWVAEWLEILRAYPGYVKFMIWMPTVLPILIPVGIFAVIMALRKHDMMPRWAFAVSGIVLLLPLSGLYHMTLFAPVFVRCSRSFVLVIGACIWALSLAPLDLRLLIVPLVFTSMTLVVNLYRPTWRKSLYALFARDANLQAE